MARGGPRRSAGSSFLGVAGILALALTFFILYRAISIPDANADFQTQTTQVYYSDGKHKIGEFALQDRESVSIDEIPASMQAAAIAAEDRSFYTNRGIDLKGIVRAVRDNTTSGAIQGGGSTITQQYVKILYLTQERSYTRKVKEADPLGQDPQPAEQEGDPRGLPQHDLLRQRRLRRRGRVAELLRQARLAS